MALLVDVVDGGSGDPHHDCLTMCCPWEIVDALDDVDHSKYPGSASVRGACPGNGESFLC